MFIIQQVTNSPNQKQTIILQDGSSLTIQMEFVSMQYGWFFTQINYKDFILQGLRITVGPDMLYQFRNQIPFGLACFTNQNREPTQLEDFSSGSFQLYILSAAEVEAVRVYLQHG